jgi:hypothetical protein
MTFDDGVITLDNTVVDFAAMNAQLGRELISYA